MSLHVQPKILDLALVSSADAHLKNDTIELHKMQFIMIPVLACDFHIWHLHIETARLCTYFLTSHVDSFVSNLVCTVTCKCPVSQISHQCANY